MVKKKHWAASTDNPTAAGEFRLACGMWAWINSAKDSGPLWSLCSAAVYRDLAACDPEWYCSDCAKAARLALAKEQPIAVSFSSTVRRCARCRSGAINPSDHGRTEGVDLDLCDVCYWRKRAVSATWPKPRPISEARETEIFGYCPDIGWRRLSQMGRKWALTGAEYIADYEPTHFLPLPPEVK